jgi:ribosomal protein S18 acetylase RimI-like enzyme
MLVDDVAEIVMADAVRLAARLSDLGALLHACVHAGASIGFILPLDQGEAEAFWAEKVLPGVRRGHVVCWLAEHRGRLAGTVQLDIGTPANQPHRAEVRKLLVHPHCRRLGIARSLMAALEAHAGRIGRRLLTLDTRTGDSAEPLYTSLGYRPVGTIPGYCLDPFTDALDATTIMYKQL